MKNLVPVALSVAFLFAGIFTLSAQERLPQFLQHKVKPGETLNAIAEQYHVSLEDLLLLNDFPPNVSVKTNQVVLIRLLQDGEKAEVLPPDYKVANSGKSATKEKEAEQESRTETVTRQAEKTVSSHPSSVSAAETTGPDGTKYKVTESNYHVVQKGQTFYRIALIYGLSVDELKSLNNLSSTNIAVGQKLRIRR